jgi:rhodanese-related sulfurtransferase
MGFILRGFVLLGAAVVCAALSNALAGPERKLHWFASADSAASRPAVTPATPRTADPPATAAPATGSGDLAPHPDKPWVEISGDQVASLFSSGSVPFLDARRTSAYREGHVKGARPFPVWEADVDDRVKAFYGEGHDPNGPIVVYCTGGDCEDSHLLAQKLFFVGFNAVFVYKDGFPDWEKRALPVAKGDTP